MHLTGFGILDDTNLVQTIISMLDTIIDVCNEMQWSIDCWAGSLKSTGSEFDNKRSICYGIDFEWIGTKWSYNYMDSTVNNISFEN